jgi:hypothetical protein
MGRKRPAIEVDRRPREAKVYRRLAALARYFGYREITRHTVHHWVTAGLLPRADSTWVAWQRRKTTIPHATECQLLAACLYRVDFGLGRHAFVGAQLWLDGYDVPTTYLRGALAAEFLRGSGASEKPVSVAKVRDSDFVPRSERENDSASDRLAIHVARQWPFIEATPSLSHTQRALLADELRSIVDGTAPSSLAVRLLADATGADRRDVRAALGKVPTVTRADVERLIAASDEDLAATRIGFQSLARAASLDHLKPSRRSARICLGMFVSAAVLEAANEG